MNDDVFIYVDADSGVVNLCLVHKESGNQISVILTPEKSANVRKSLEEAEEAARKMMPNL